MLYAKFWKVASPIPISDETRPKICPKPSPGKIMRTKSAKTFHKRGRKIPSLKKTKLPVCQPNQLQGLHEVLFPFSKLSARLSAYEIGFRILSRVLEVLFAKFCNMRKSGCCGVPLLIFLDTNSKTNIQKWIFFSEYLEVNLRPLVGLVYFFQCRKCYLSFIGLICLSAVVNMHEDDSLVTNRLSGFFSNGLDGCKHFVWIFFVSSSLFSGRGR